jgi:hypothetical protein
MTQFPRTGNRLATCCRVGKPRPEKTIPDIYGRNCGTRGLTSVNLRISFSSSEVSGRIKMS